MVWTVVLLSVLVAGLGSHGLFVLGLADRLTEQLQVAWAVTGGVQHAAALAARDPTPTFDGAPEGWWRLSEWAALHDPAVIHMDVGGGLVDEDRKVNLNTAPADVLERLFHGAGLRRTPAQELAAAIADWRDEDRVEREWGAEDSYYRGLTEAYECKDGPFESVEELLLVRGMTPALWVQVAPWVTVAGSGKVNLNTAGREVLTTLGLSGSGVAGLLAYRAGDDGQQGTGDDRALISTAAVWSDLNTLIPTEDLNRLTELAEFIGVKSDAFRLTVTGQLVEAPTSRMRVTSIVTRQGQVTQWSEE